MTPTLKVLLILTRASSSPIIPVTTALQANLARHQPSNLLCLAQLHFMTLGAKLKQARADHQLTQQAVATQVAVSRQTISSWETGKSFPDIDSLVTLSNLYGLSLDILIKEDTGMLDYLRKSEILRKLRPIYQSMQILNFLFLIILTFFSS